MRYVANVEDLDDFKIQRENLIDPEVSERVARILNAVNAGGDRALMQLTETYDGMRFENAKDFKVPVTQLREALEALEPGLREALELAAANIRTFHQLQRPESMVWEQRGKRVALRLDPLPRAALYVPGGMAAYPSSVLMNAIPAQVAGVPEIAVFTPPTRDRHQRQAVYATCALLGLTEVYTLGGAQAVAAATFGTETIKPCAIITGPGNQYVTEAKRQVMHQVKIDMLAGPSELLIVCDERADPQYIAADLLAQAEHDSQAGLFLVVIGDPMTTAALAKRIQGSILDLLTIGPSQNAALSIQNLAVYGCPSVYIASKVSNAIAPEHLSLQFENCETATDYFTAAGSIFVGNYTPEAVADYAAGANHVLPTAGTSRFTSALGVATFQKATQVVCYTKEGLQADGLASMVIAQRERLPYHAKSLALRLNESLKLCANENTEAFWLDGPLEQALLAELPNTVRTYPEDGYNSLQLQLLTMLQMLFPDKGALLAGGYASTTAFESNQNTENTLLDSLALGNGSDELLDVLLRALLPAGTKVALLNPTFSEYERFLSINKLVGVSIESDPHTGFYCPDALLQNLITASKTCGAVLLCNPNNPTGQRFDDSWIKGLISQMSPTCLLILDEAYMDFSPEQDSEPWYALEFENVIQVRTLSKAYGAAGLRLGYAFMAPSLKKDVQPYLAPYRLSHPTVRLASMALATLSTQRGSALFFQNRSAMLIERAKLLQFLHLPSGIQLSGNFLWLSLSSMQHQALENNHLRVRTFSGHWAPFVRITIGTPMQMQLITNSLQQGVQPYESTHYALA